MSVFSIGDKVRIVNCSECQEVLGRVATIKNVAEDGRCHLNFGRGRPCKDRPAFFNASDLELDGPPLQVPAEVQSSVDNLVSKGL